MSNFRKYVICLGGYENTLAVARYVQKYGFKTLYYNFDETPASFSKYVQFRKLKKLPDEKVLYLLLKAEEHSGYKNPLIFFNNDYFVSFANKYREVLSKAFRFIIPDYDIIKCALNKSKMNQILPAELLPRSFMVETGNQYKNLTLPFLVKPKITSEETPFKTKRIISISDMTNFSKMFSNRFEDFLFQEIIDDPEGRLISVFFYRSPSGTFHSLAVERERMNPPWGGIGTLIKLANCNFIQLIECLLSQINYVGLGEIDTFSFRNKITLFDLNARLPSWAFFAEKCGKDLMGLYLKDLSDGSFTIKDDGSNQEENSIKAIDIINDLIVIFHPEIGILRNREISLKQYLKSLTNIRCFFIFNISDFRPFVFKLKTAFRNTFRKYKNIQ